MAKGKTVTTPNTGNDAEKLDHSLLVKILYTSILENSMPSS